MQTTTYNGWKNWATRNVALWIQNDESLYTAAKETPTYSDFVNIMTEFEIPKTPDGAAWEDKDLDIPALDEMISEL